MVTRCPLERQLRGRGGRPGAKQRYGKMKCKIDHKTALTFRLLTYPLNAVKNKITIYQEDYDRLNDDEFLNDTIIEFYLTYRLTFPKVF